MKQVGEQLKPLLRTSAASRVKAYRGGTLATGTRLVRVKDGSRVGLAKAGWAMLIRTLLMPLLFLAAIGGSADGPGVVRVSIDSKATERLKAGPFQRVG